MPYQFLPSQGPETRLRLWPHRSLTRQGFVWFIGATAALIALPLAGLIGNPALWVLLPFLILAVTAVWLALTRNDRDARIVEDLVLTPDLITLTRTSAKGRQDWQANPYWVRLTLHETGGPVPNYLTLRGNDREVELGAFLSEEERITLRADLATALERVR
ncbi:DUF2244 domain-containing protein [Tabrizicola sp.]|uniref:DUF2244 domain-containing protein n=1 Tax=Tabrizicola sp. TaxID=2005166 RepID=UPI00286BAF3E|nr:DUF2244 domain-containing protein [Tabrizicola sp.]